MTLKICKEHFGGVYTYESFPVCPICSEIDSLEHKVKLALSGLHEIKMDLAAQIDRGTEYIVKGPNIKETENAPIE